VISKVGERSVAFELIDVVGRQRAASSSDEVATLAALLMGADGAFITGSDFLIDGGVTASYFYGELAPE
jgi:hypothetical protein